MKEWRKKHKTNPLGNRIQRQPYSFMFLPSFLHSSFTPHLESTKTSIYPLWTWEEWRGVGRREVGADAYVLTTTMRTTTHVTQQFVEGVPIVSHNFAAFSRWIRNRLHHRLTRSRSKCQSQRSRVKWNPSFASKGGCLCFIFSRLLWCLLPH